MERLLRRKFVFSCASGGDRYNLPAQPLSKGSIIIHK